MPFSHPEATDFKPGATDATQPQTRTGEPPAKVREPGSGAIQGALLNISQTQEYFPTATASPEVEAPSRLVVKVAPG